MNKQDHYIKDLSIVLCSNLTQMSCKQSYNLSTSHIKMFSQFWENNYYSAELMQYTTDFTVLYATCDLNILQLVHQLGCWHSTYMNPGLHYSLLKYSVSYPDRKNSGSLVRGVKGDEQMWGKVRHCDKYSNQRENQMAAWVICKKESDCGLWTNASCSSWLWCWFFSLYLRIHSTWTNLAVMFLHDNYINDKVLMVEDDKEPMGTF